MKAVLAGSFDPMTLGHLDLVRRGRQMFDEVIVACGHNVNKRTLFDLDERLDILRESVADIPGVTVLPFSGLLIHFCQAHGVKVILRGLRVASDFDFELRIGLANRDMAPELETIFLLTDPQLLFVSSSLVKEIAAMGGDVSRYLPEPALRRLRDRPRVA
jgi:pantetheine-phosphate adenylyltransferase